MKIMYRVPHLCNLARILKVQVYKQTDKCIWYMWGGEAKKKLKVSDLATTFENFGDAKDCIVKQAEYHLKAAEKALKQAQDVYAKALVLEEKDCLTNTGDNWY